MFHRLTLAALVPVLLLVAPMLAYAQPKGALAGLRDKLNFTTDVEYGKAGDVSLKLDVFEPTAKSDKPRPCIVWIHGGGWQGGNKSNGLGRLASFVASGDYVGVSVEYRLTDVASWPAQINDCKAAIRWIRAHAKQYNIDPDKIGVWGASAGGHLVSLLGTSGDVKEVEGDNGSPGVSSRVTCVVDFCGPSDFLLFGADSPQLNRPGQPVYKLLNGPLKDRLDMAKQASPVTHVSKDDPPFLIMHGTKDNLVPLSQAERLQTALKGAGVDSKFVQVIGGGHGFGGPEVNQRVKAFFDRQLLGKDVAVSEEPIEQSAAK